jgi:hypothetical protein
MTSTIPSIKDARSGSYTVQVLIALVVLIGIVGGVTFISQYQTDDGAPSAPSPSPSATASTERKPLSYPHDLWFPITQKKWEPASEGDFERKVPGHYDFWFENRNAVPIELGIKSKSCKCAELALCILSPEESKRYQAWANFAAVDQTVAGFRGTVGALCQLAMQDEKIPEIMGARLTWMEKPPDLEKGIYVDRQDKNPTILAPGGAGILRLNWGGNKAVSTAEKLSVRLWMECPEDPKRQRSEVGIELPLSFVTVLRVHPSEVNLDEFRQGDVKKAEFFCWSSLDGYFPLKVEEIRRDPSVECAWERLSHEDCQRIAATSPESRVRAFCGYKVTLTVHERLSDAVQMPLGPFTRKVLLSSRPGMDDVGITLTGTVRGDVMVGSEEDQGKINLGSFNANTGIQKTVRLTTLTNAMELQLDRVEPPTIDYLKVKFKRVAGASSEGQTRWELCVEVPAGSPPGALPFDCAVYLKSPGKSVRDIRIPVSGQAYQ